ncbi:conserved hypothetical protein [Ricinus communis]|uniref:Uncharacterized protein n=1 Tax=Ricinus communis TaxID=3988 RepID=B9TDL9_RICCO|nr:conserved hypothetical protein [Ricinus communis]
MRLVARRGTAAKQHRIDLPGGEHARHGHTGALRHAAIDLVARRESRVDEQLAQAREPDLVVAARQILRGRQALARGT